MKNFIMALACAALVVTCSQDSHAGSVAGLAKKGAAVAYAKVSADGFVEAAGGKGTTSASSVAGDGTQTITFLGKYPDDLTANNVIPTSTAQAANYGVTNVNVVYADATTIVVTVYDWRSDNTLQFGSSIFLVLHVGL
jgi:hypothetical protein